MNNRLKKKKQYGTGTAVTNYIENPATELTQNEINISKAKYEAMSNPLNMILGQVGNMAMAYGIDKAGGIGGFFDGLGEGVKNVKDKYFEMGGEVPEIPVEVEGGEVYETPDGEMGEFQGKKHEQGGIDIALPEGTMIFSEQLKIGGKSLADRKLMREKRMDRIMKRLEKNPTDKLLKNTAERTEQINMQEEMEDVKLQEVASALDGLTQFAAYGTSKYGLKSYPFGSPIGGISGGTGGSSEGAGDEEDGGVPWTAGDILGMIGTAYGAFAPLINTERNRASDTPNINAFEDYGQEALQTNSQAFGYLQSQQDNAKRDLTATRTAALKSNRNKSRGLNQIKAFDVNTFSNADKALADLYDKFSGQMVGLLDKKAMLQNEKDFRVMSGEQERDLNDRKDKDNYFTQRATNIANVSNAIQKGGRDLNTHKQNQDFLDILPDLSAYGLGYTYDKNGKLTLKKIND